MNNNQKVDQLHFLLSELRDIMLRERPTGWLDGIELMLNKLETNQESGYFNSYETILIVTETYQSMIPGGYGGFYDYMIWRDNYDERVRLNDKLNAVRDEIFEIVSGVSQ